ncbi:hypothetical protein DPMN_146548 [Dreissena polymorpha]|uniref:Uncharacterized protein n=1 Tax=Dreissena polymorpha TaxID=45954 RepID=A0A9D4FAI9_DREPO|nr:hypothetical protein DPMN_146548 [Dreissena polymorpha]
MQLPEILKFHEDRKINVVSRVLHVTRFYYNHIGKNAPPPGSHVFQPTGIIFELFQEDRTVNVASRVLTRFYYSHIRKKEKCPAPLKPCFSSKHNLTINVASREKCPAPGGHVFKTTKTIFELIQDIIGKNLLTKLHDEQQINVTSRKKMPRPRGGHVFQPTGIIF